jgi:hypothetical protein
MTRNRPLILAAIVLGLLFLAIAALYFADPARSLPSFFPGHTGTGSAEAGHHHTKHGIAALAVALGSFVFAWFQTGPRRTSPA